MEKWMSVKVRSEKTMENGLIKKVNEVYLLDADTFTEAEMRITEELCARGAKELQVQAIKKENYSDVWFAEPEKGEKWYKVRYAVITIENGKEKKSYSNALILSDSTASAEKEFKVMMCGPLADMVIVGVSETNFEDVLLYESKEDENN